MLDIGLRFSNAGPDGQVDNVVRPESITISHSSEYIHNDLMALRGQIDDIIFLGPYINCRITAAKRMVTVLVSSSSLPEGMISGSDVFLTWKSEDNTVIDGK